ARVPPVDWNMDWPFTPCAPDSAIRDCLPGLAPAVYRVRFCAALYPLLAQNDELHLPRRRQPAKLLRNEEKSPSAYTGRTHAAQRESCRPLPLLSVLLRCERRTGPPPPVSTAGTPPTSAWIHATTHGLGVGDACE
ncbi:exo-alpha-sialidase, partial [Trypanosoma cruzi]